MLSSRRSKIIIGLALLLSASCGREKDRDDYLAVVRRYADALIAHGRDHYGRESSPLFASALDQESLSLPEGEKLKAIEDLDPSEWGIRKNDRTLTGANVMHQENLYQILYALAAVTGEQRYADEADQSLRFFFSHCQSPVTGLFVWGEHMGWDFRTDTVMEHYNKIKHSVGEGTTHEFYRPWVLWNRSFQLDAEACQRFAAGLWDHQIYDHETGDFSRHAKWDRHGPGQHNQFPRHGGFYIATWSEAYKRSGDPVFLKGITTMLHFFERNRSPESDAIPAEVGNKRSEGKMMWPSSNLSLAIDLWDAAENLPDTLAEEMRKQAARTDKVFLKVPNDLGPQGKGFVTTANVHTLQPEDINGLGMRLFSDLWATGYGEATDARMANLCYLRYAQIKDPRYADLVLAAARRYLNSEPNIDFPVYPGTLGDVIYLLLEAYELSGEEQQYLDRANHFASSAQSMFLTSSSPLPAASSRHTHYEAITREDTLMMALLKLYMTRNKDKTDVSLVWCDR